MTKEIRNEFWQTEEGKKILEANKKEVSNIKDKIEKDRKEFIFEHPDGDDVA